MLAALPTAGGAGRRRREGDGTRYLLVVPRQDALHRLGAAAPLHSLQHRAQLRARLRARLHARPSRPARRRRERPRPARAPRDAPDAPRGSRGTDGQAASACHWLEGPAARTPSLRIGCRLSCGERTPSPSKPNGAARPALLPRGTMGAVVRAHNAEGSLGKSGSSALWGRSAARESARHILPSSSSLLLAPLCALGDLRCAHRLCHKSKGYHNQGWPVFIKLSGHWAHAAGEVCVSSLKRGFATASGSKTNPIFLKSNPPEQRWYTKILQFVQEGKVGCMGRVRQR